MMNIQTEGNAHTYHIHAQNDRGEVYVIHVEDDWGELAFYQRAVLVETIPIEGKTLEQTLTMYVIPDLT